MPSSIMSLNLKDVSKGLVVAVLAAFLGAGQQALGEHGLAFAQYDWYAILDVVWKAGVGYISLKFFSNREDKFMGVIG